MDLHQVLDELSALVDEYGGANLMHLSLEAQLQIVQVQALLLTARGTLPRPLA